MNEVRLGSRTLQPGRQLLADGQREPLGKRALDILSVLAEANGAIVTKDELLAAVWPGAIVEENALQVHIVALRKALGPDAGRLTTIRGVGYRLDTGLQEGGQPAKAVAEPAAHERTLATWLTRRKLTAGVIGTAVLGAAGFVILRQSPTQTPPGVQPLLDQAWQAWTQGTMEGNSQAIGLYRRAIERAPEFADAWGLLACAYADRAQVWASAAEQPALRRQSREAGQRALQLDPRNAYGRAALAYARPVRGNWWLIEREFRHAERDQPDKAFVAYGLAWLFTHTGRLSEAAALFDRLRGEAPAATQYFFHVAALWGSGQTEAAERLLQEAEAIYASHPMIWRSRFDMLVYGGQLRLALALAEDAAGRANGPSQQWLNRRAAVVRALVNRDERQARNLSDELLREGRASAEWTGRAILDLAVLGRLDEAFSLADAFYFSRGFAVPDARSANTEAPAVTLNARATWFLFMPPLEAMRADPRFERLVEELGLVRYWRDSRSEPDFRRA